MLSKPYLNGVQLFVDKNIHDMLQLPLAEKHFPKGALCHLARTFEIFLVIFFCAPSPEECGNDSKL
uniref:Uncharacterized protein n=1 Tax=Romanomermis culicivorax TaxID=13658 RepID=A0A915ITW7_ROMCU